MSRRRVDLPAGAAAYVFEEAARRRAAEERIVERLRSSGYREAMVPSADYLAPYAPHLDEREERELYRFVDRHGDTVALRADFTIALARHLAPRQQPEDGPTRVFYRGEVLRGGPREGAGGEFCQIGAELLGAAGPEADVEIVSRCLECLQTAGAGPVWLVLSHVGAIEALVTAQAAGERDRPRGSIEEPGALPHPGALGGGPCGPPNPLVAAIRQRRVAETRRLAGQIRADFELPALRLVEGGIGPEDPILSLLGPAGEDLAATARELSRRFSGSITIDLAEPPARSYHTGFFFSVFGETGGEPIAGGGRYDGLYAAFGRPRPAVGFSLGLEALMRA